MIDILYESFGWKMSPNQRGSSIRRREVKISLGKPVPDESRLSVALAVLNDFLAEANTEVVVKPVGVTTGIKAKAEADKEKIEKLALKLLRG
jgi:hypothetical protein